MKKIILTLFLLIVGTCTVSAQDIEYTAYFLQTDKWNPSTATYTKHGFYRCNADIHFLLDMIIVRDTSGWSYFSRKSSYETSLKNGHTTEYYCTNESGRSCTISLIESSDIILLDTRYDLFTITYEKYGQYMYWVRLKKK